MTIDTFQTPEVPNRKLDKNVDLAAVLALVKEDVQYSINCHAVGTIESFDPSNQTARVKINYLRTSYISQSSPTAYVPSNTPYPLLIDCPVIFLTGGTARLTFPITPGDTCLVLFNDRSLDNWFATGQIGPLNSLRAHSISDGMVLVGLNPATRVPTDYDPVRAVLKNGLASVGVGPSLIKVANASTTLGTQMQHLITNLTSFQLLLAAFMTATAAAVTPADIATAAATFNTGAAMVIPNLTAIATLFAGLLE